MVLKALEQAFEALGDRIGRPYALCIDTDDGVRSGAAERLPGTLTADAVARAARRFGGFGGPLPGLLRLVKTSPISDRIEELVQFRTKYAILDGSD